MTFFKKLEKRVSARQTYLCVGLDPVWEKIPEHLPHSQEGLLEFLLQIVNETKDHVAVFKPNFAYFEALGPSGMEVLQELIQKIPPEIPVIGDAKRGDVGHSSRMYAKAVFETFGCDAVTVTPYLGHDALEPFLDNPDRGVFVLCLTSNSGANDFQLPDLHLKVAKKVREWNIYGNAGLVVGATRPENIAAIREISGRMPYLIPGVGTQGGDLRNTLFYADDGSKIPYLISTSRSILYASSKEDFAQQAGTTARKLQDQINLCRSSL